MDFAVFLVVELFATVVASVIFGKVDKEEGK